MKSPQAVIVDLDNTVYPYQPCHEAGLLHAWTSAATLDRCWKVKAEFSRDYAQARRAVKSRTGGQAAEHSRLLYFKDMVEARWGRTDAEAVLELREAYWGGYESQMTPDPGCAEYLDDLRKRGVSLAWVTNNTTERQLSKLRRLGLEGAADFLITSEEAGAEKPDPAPLDLALSKLGSRPEETWMIGDSLTEDIAAARTRNLTAVWFRRHGASEEGPVPVLIVGDWFELREVLRHGHDS